jgi:hypothetical protein
MQRGPFDSLLRHIRGIAQSATAARQEDAELLERFLSDRDEDAFEALVRRHGPMVLGVCRRLLLDPCDAALSVGVLAGVLAEKGLAALPVPLVVSTVKAAVAAGRAPAAGVISPAAAALTEGVLHAMFMKKLMVLAAVVFLLGALSAAGALTYPTLAARQNEGKEPEKPAPAAKAEDRLQTLLKERVDAAKSELEARKQEYDVGRTTLDHMLGAAKRLLVAQQELTDKKADQIAALEAYLKLTTQAEKESKAGFEAGRITQANVAESTYYRLEAEIWLERAKAK